MLISNYTSLLIEFFVFFFPNFYNIFLTIANVFLHLLLHSWCIILMCLVGNDKPVVFLSKVLLVLKNRCEFFNLLSLYSLQILAE